MNDKNLTVYQKLTKVFGYQEQPGSKSPSFQFNKDELLKTNNKSDFEQSKLQAQQSQFLFDKWKKVDQSLYNQSVYYEPNRLSAYYDYESMEFSISSETKIATPDGFITIKELADKGKDYEFITYAYDHNLKKVVPAKAYNAHYTRDEMTYKITFDNDSYIIATYGHRFLKRDGVFEYVENLKSGDSMMPFYRKSFYNNENYNWIYTCNSNEGHHGWVSEHNLIAEWFYDKKINKEEEVHHIDFNGKNNLPENLKIMNINKHRSYHCKLNNKKLWSNPDYVKKMKEVAKRPNNFSWNGRRSGKNNPAYFDLNIKTIINSAIKNKTIRLVSKDLNVSIPKIQKVLKFYGFKHWFNFLDTYNIERKITDHIDEKNNNFKKLPWDLLIESAKNNITTEKTAKSLGISKNKILKTIRNGGYNDWITFLNAYGIKKSKHYHPRKKDKEVINHKIKSIEPYGVIPVYDLTVPGYKNFATDTIFSHNTPEVSAALDIYSEESTTMSEKGQILTVYSESNRIKKILEDLFNNILDINTNLQMWTRGMCKYGDNFVYLKIDEKKGIIGCQQLPNIEIERIEGGSGDNSLAAIRIEPMKNTRELRFSWKNKDMEMQSWEMAHFRILGDDRKLPYGTSMLDKIRRIWKQLLLAEDAMLVYRTSRAPERRVFKVFVGNMDDDDVEPYVQKIANKFKRDQVVDQTNGQVDMRYNQLAVDQDYFIPVRDHSATSPIETLPGAGNLGEIADIEYIQKKLLAALRIPKAFLGFEEVVGDGKNLALMDIRFARTINRIQKSLIQELNKIAIIHLYILGLEDELSNFSLSLSNPSAQSDLLSIEQWKEKILLYKDATSDQSNLGITPVSHTWAKKNILGFSDNEVLLDLQQQRLERAIGFELTNSPQIIKRTGVFDEVDKKYGIPEDERKKLEYGMDNKNNQEGGMDLGGDIAGGMGGDLGGDFGGDMGGDFDTGIEADDTSGPLSENNIFNIMEEKINLNELFKLNKTQKGLSDIQEKINKLINQ